ncbi:hypothetical protein A2U01_0030448, partial [Trifolium medium]|nr:hypothetical protein [Trifolium medium]
MACCVGLSDSSRRCSASCALRRVEWRVAPSRFEAEIAFWKLRVAQGSVARRADESGNTQKRLCKWRVTQRLPARCAGHVARRAGTGFVRIYDF